MRLSVPSRPLALPLRVKVLTAVAAACVVALTVGIVGVLQLGALQQRSQEINTDALVPSNQIVEVRRAFLQTHIDALADELLPDAAAAAKAHELYLADIEAMDAAIEAYTDSGLTTAQEQQVAALSDAWEQYESLVSSDAYRLAVHQGRFADVLAMRSNTIAPVAAELNAALDELLVSGAAAAQQSVQAATDTYESARTLVLVLLVVGLAAAVVLALLVARLITPPVVAVRNGLMAMAAGDLTTRVEVSSGDEVGQMAEALNQAAESLRGTVSSTAESASALAAAAEQLSASSESIAQRFRY